MVSDLKYLSQMTGGDSAIMQDMVNMFVAQLEETQTGLQKLYGEGNWYEMGRLAHKTKSSSLVMGAQQLADEMISLEANSKQDNPSELCKKNIEAFNLLADTVRAELATLSLSKL